MIKVGNILIDYDSIATVVNSSYDEGEVIQIIYKNGIVKNFLPSEVGMDFETFIKELEKVHSMDTNKYLFKMLAMFQNGNTPS